jgi:rod shape-determining protein MreD
MKANNRWVIVLSLVFAATLAVFPLPTWLARWRPDWVALVLIYWVIALPHRFGMLAAFSMGIVMDVLEGTVLGLHAGIFTILAWFGLTLYQRIRMFTPIQQSLTLLMLIGLGQALLFWIFTALGKPKADSLAFVITAVISAVIWPLVFVGLRFCRRYFQVT